MDQAGKAANTARGQLNRGKNISLSPLAPENECGLAGWVRPSRPASAFSFSILRLSLVLSHGIPPNFRGGVHLFI